MAICPKCGAGFPEAGGFCPHDGARLTPDKTVIAARPGPARTRPGSTPPPPADLIPTPGPRDSSAPPRRESFAPPPRDSSAPPRDSSAPPPRDSIPPPPRDSLAPPPRDSSAPPPGDEYRRLIGQTLDGRYLIAGKLGEGGMGVVYLAHHVVIEKPVAIKILKREVANEPSVAQRFIQEARAASRIDHPNIVDVTDFGVTPDGLTYQVMELIEGVTLAQALRDRGPMPVERALPIIAQMCRALIAAHAKGIVHRDLKPENVFLMAREGRQDFVKIVDFGIAKVTSGGDGPRLTRAGLVFGTPEYMAPEQAAGKTDTDHRIDVYAVGTILYEMLVGRVPFHGESAVRTLGMQMLEPVVPPRRAAPGLAIDDAVEALILRTLEKDRERRFATMAALFDALAAAAGDLPLDQPLSVGLIDPGGSPPFPLGSAAGGPLGPVTGRRRVPSASNPPPGVPRRVRSESPPRPRPPSAGPAPSSTEPAGPTAAGPAPSQIIERETAPPGRRLVVVLIVGFLAVVGGAAGLLVMGRGHGDEVPPDASPAGLTRDAGGPAASSPGDAAATAVARDAGGPAANSPADAATTATARDAGAIAIENHVVTGRPRDADAGSLGGGEHEITIHTRPSGGRLYLGATLAGPDGTHIRRPRGTKLTVTCRLAGLGDGRVKVEFDGINPTYVCALSRTKKCVKGLMNPFDDCPDE